jgi:hypothetical protein
MNYLGNVVRHLQQERARAQKEVERFDAALAALNGSANHRGGRRGHLSAAGKARIAQAQRARWAKVRGQAQPAVPKSSPRKRTLSSAARRRIAAAQRARWAKLKAAKKKAA